MSYSSERKNKYLFGMFLIIVIPIAIILYFVLYTAPTCSDGKFNQGEEGIDCGGPCELVCSFKTADPIVKWSRAVETTQDVYGAVALIENTNMFAEAYNLSYVFKLYDSNGILINERFGKAYIPNNLIFPIFEGNLQVGNRIPTKASFEFIEKASWREVTELNEKIVLSNIEYVEKNKSPRVLAKIENKSVRDVRDLELIVLLYDTDNNLVNSSKTIIDSLKKDSSQNLIFTWPELFEKEVIKIDIVPVSKLN